MPVTLDLLESETAVPTVQALDSLAFPDPPEERSTLRMPHPQIPQADNRPTEVADEGPQITQLPRASAHADSDTRLDATTWEEAPHQGLDELPVPTGGLSGEKTWLLPVPDLAPMEPTRVLSRGELPTRIQPAPPSPRQRRKGADSNEIAVTSSLAGLAVVIMVTLTVGGFLIVWQMSQ